MFLICENLGSLPPRMLCVKIGWNWLSASGEENFFISSMYFRYFIRISPWKRVGPFIWTNLNPLHSPKDALCQVRLLLAQWFWRRFFNFVNEISLFRNYLPFILTITQALYKVWLKLAQWFLRRRWKCEVYRRTENQTDDVPQVIRRARLSFQLRWTKYDRLWNLQNPDKHLRSKGFVILDTGYHFMSHLTDIKLKF